MPNNPEKLVQDLILFYVKENYNIYLREHQLKKIPDSSLDTVISELYSQRKDHLKEFIKSSLKEIMKDDYVGDLVINNMLIDNQVVDSQFQVVEAHQQKKCFQLY